MSEPAEDEDEGKPGDVRFKVSPQFWSYLRWLSRNTLLGKTANDVARQVLTARLSEMRQEDFKDGQKP